jgi:hypothetical protein
MTMITLTQNEQPVSSGFRVDVSRGERIGRVSSEWFSRPDDERYLSLIDLHDAVRRRAERAQARTVESRAVKVETACDNAERLALLVPGRWHPHIGALGNCAGLSARRHPICGSFPRRWPGSICNMACSHTAPSC